MRSLVPFPLRHFLRLRLRPYRLFLTKTYLDYVLHKRAIKIIIGSRQTSYAGWVATDKDILNLLQEKDWAQYFWSSSLDALLAEHVWEHLSADEGCRAAKICFQYLKPGGYLRAAVPDGLHPDPKYIEQVTVHGSGQGAPDHKVLYTYLTFREVFTAAGFEVLLYEYFDEDGHFHFTQWNSSDGMISRSQRYDARNSTDPLTYTSIILDAKKPSST
jgi:predicted SAM-dependent methyltransferase